MNYFIIIFTLNLVKQKPNRLFLKCTKNNISMMTVRNIFLTAHVAII